MNEYLVIRLGAHALDPIHWLVWSQSELEIIASGCLGNGAAALAELQRAETGGRPIIGLVPGSEVLFREVSLPGKLTRQNLKALPYLLEEVASEVDSLHLVVLGGQGAPGLAFLLAVESQAYRRSGSVSLRRPGSPSKPWCPMSPRHCHLRRGAGARCAA